MHPAKVVLPSSRSVAAIVFGLGLLLALVGVVSLFAAELAQLPAPWRQQDVGKMEVAGAASFAGGIYTVKGTQDIWGTNDGFHYVFQMLTGDGEITARVTGVQNTLNHAKGGVMIRESLEAGAKEVCAAVTPVDGAQFLFRAEANAPTKVTKLAINKGMFPYWVKLVRKGDTFSGFESLDGQAWKLTGSTNVTMTSKVFIGLTASSHVKDVLCAATFDQVTVQPSLK